METEKPLGRGIGILNLGDGRQMAVGWWNKNWTPKSGSPMAGVHKSFNDAMALAESHLKRRAEAQSLVHKGGQRPERPWEAAKRAQNWKAQAAVIDKAKTDLAQAIHANEMRMRALRPVDLSNDTGTVFRRGEIRSALAAMKAEQREAALEQPEVRAAVLEQPSALSGLTDVRWQRLRDEALQARYGNELEEIAATREAAELAERALNAASTLAEEAVGDLAAQ